MELIRTDLQYYEPTHTLHSMFTESTDAIVPDAEPDIGHILCAYASVTVKDELPQSDRILLSGNASVTVLYRPDGQDAIRLLQIPLSFAHIEETPGILPDSPCFLRCQVGSVAARAVNSRKVNVAVTFVLEIDVFAESGLTLTEEIDPQGEALELLYGQQTVSLLCYAAAREFTVLDDLELPGAQGLRLICARGALRPAGCQPSPDQLTLSGEALLWLLLMDDTGALVTMTQAIPYTQVLDAPGLRGSLPTCARLALRSLDCMLREDGVLSVGLGVRALVTQQAEQTIQVIRDLYHLHRELHCDTREVTLCTYAADAPFQLESAVQMPVGRAAAEILSADGTCLSAEAHGGALEAQIQVCLLYRDPTGAVCAESQPLTVPLAATGLPEGAAPQDLSVQLSAAPGGEGSVSLRVTATGNLVTQAQIPIRDITALCADAPRQPADQPGTTLVLRYIHTPTPLWEIAKQYASTAQAIRQANALPEGTETAADTMLLIPVYAQ